VLFTGTSATLSYDYTYTARGQLNDIKRYSDLTGTNLIGSTSFSYDAHGNLTHEQHKTGAGVNIENTTLTYDSFNRLTNKQVDGTLTTYQYDATNQLTSDAQASYSYDANGNRNMAHYTTGTGNQTTNDGCHRAL
jgi:hypothetical protein